MPDHADHFTVNVQDMDESFAEKLFLDGGEKGTEAMLENLVREKMEETMVERKMKLDFEVKTHTSETVPQSWLEVVGDAEKMAQWYWNQYKHMDMFTPFFWYKIAREQLGNPVTENEQKRAERIEKKLRKLLRKEQAKKYAKNPKKLKQVLRQLDEQEQARSLARQVSTLSVQDKLQPVPVSHVGSSTQSMDTDLQRSESIVE